MVALQCSPDAFIGDEKYFPKEMLFELAIFHAARRGDTKYFTLEKFLVPLDTAEN